MTARVLRSAIPALLVTLAACEEDFDPIAAIDGIYSINGYLDASADTQWVRVTPIRTSILTTPDPVDAVVTLEHLGTGQVIEMHDTIFTFASPNFDGAVAYGHNFWTDEPIEQGATYRLVATRSDGESSTATVRIPKGLDASSPVMVQPRSLDGRSGVVLRFEIAAGDHLAVLGMNHYRKPAPHRCNPSGRPADLDWYPFQTGRPAGPIVYETELLVQRITLSDPPECVAGPMTPISTPRETYIRWDGLIVLSGERWPFALGDAIGYLGQGSNIQNGVGYLGGVMSTAVPIIFAGGVYYFGAGTSTVVLKTIWNGEEFNFEEDRLSSAQLQSLTDGSTRRREIALPLSYVVPQEYFPDLPPGLLRFRGLLPGQYRIRTPFSADFYCTESTFVLGPDEHRVVELEVVRRVDSPTEPLNANGCREG